MTDTLLGALRRKQREVHSPFPHQAAIMLNNPLRRVMMKPAGIIERLGLNGTERVLEIGPGPGFFSVEIAKRLDAGKLDLFDVQPEMLEKAERQLVRAGFHDVGFTAGEAGDGLPFPNGTFDVAFLAAVIGEVPDPRACLRSLRSVLKPGGRLVFLEMFPDPDRLSVRQLRELAEPEGFAFVESEGNRWKQIVSFRSDLA
ncbi:class I SAM-dependent methyltransferase [Mycobacterium sp. 1081908.1]|uniref:class I SAM-dependent methyltransferase n=1 Tax=Mycobacterium sp. 1081908.1 TaxID=1834066 RepID=UPI00080254F1|nr:ubiquinone biosynthesis methyltransferase UbiE [Mycobacterium sp. 1081908.1]